MSNWLIYRTFWDLTISGIVLGLIYALVALGYTMVYGVLRLINFAHSEIFMVGTFGVLISLTNVFGISLFEDGDYPYRSGFVLVAILLCSTIAAMVVSGAGAVVLERTAYRPLRGAGDTYGAVVLAFLTGLVASFLFSDQIMTNLAISAVVTGPVAYGYVRIFRRGRQAPRLAFLISAIGASMALAEAVATWGPDARSVYTTPRVLEKKVLFNFLGADIRIDYVIVAVGAVLMMKFAEQAAPYFETAEIIEFHHNAKADAPSGTAMVTAQRMAAASDEWAADPTKHEVIPGARGGVGPGGIHVHGVRMVGMTASQEVILGTAGQTLVIRHDSNDRVSFMPGVVLACRKVGDLKGLTMGIDSLL